MWRERILDWPDQIWMVEALTRDYKLRSRSEGAEVGEVGGGGEVGV